MRRHLTVIRTFISRDGESDDMRRYLMVIRTFLQPKESEPVEMQRPIWSSVSYVEDSMSIDRDYFSLTFAIQRQSSPLACGDTSRLSAPCHPETASPMTCKDTSWLSAPFINQRQASPLTCRDQYGHLLPLSKTRCLSTKTPLV